METKGVRTLKSSVNSFSSKSTKVLDNLFMDVDGEIALVTINRPASLNALNLATLRDIKQCFYDISERKDIKVVILTGSGNKAFVAGADISQMVDFEPKDGRDLTLLGIEAFNKIEQMPQITIAAINGYALGGGLELALSCDIRVASDKAKFGMPETGLGIPPGIGGTQRLPRIIGKGRAKELIFTNDVIDAQEAHRIGLANKVVPHNDLLDTCMTMAKKIASKGNYANYLAKSAINQGLDLDLTNGLKLEADLFALAFASKDQKEGMTAFMEKRKANLIDF